MLKIHIDNINKDTWSTCGSFLGQIITKIHNLEDWLLGESSNQWKVIETFKKSYKIDKNIIKIIGEWKFIYFIIAKKKKKRKENIDSLFVNFIKYIDFC